MDLPMSSMAQEGGRPVLVAVDNSEESERSLTYYLDHLHKDGTRLILLHCTKGEQESVTPPRRSRPEVRYDNWMERWDGQAKADKLKERYDHLLVGRRVQATFEVEPAADPALTILSTAKRTNARAIVLGSRGEGYEKPKRSLGALGRLSDYVIKNSHVPLVLYRDSQR